MRNLRVFLISVFGLLVSSGAAAGAQANGGDWIKSYSIGGKASLTVSTGDASLDVHSCGCREVRIRVDWRDRKASDFTTNEFQSGDHVNFELKEKPRLGLHIVSGHWREPEVTVETPSALDLEGRTADGSLHVAGISGAVQLHTSDGSVDVSDVSGSLRLTASDGSIHIHNVNGTLDSHSSDGSAEIEGRFTAFQVHTSDGRLDMKLDEGTQLNAASRIEVSDGHLTVRLPKTLSADLDVQTGDGGIKCDLPLTMDGYDSGRNSGHNLRGRLNSGGVPLTIHAGDGGVTIAAL